MVKMSDLQGIKYFIEDGIPIPSSNRSPDFQILLNVVMTMKIGQSMLLSKGRDGTVYRLARATGFKFAQRKIAEDKLRFWRIA